MSEIKLRPRVQELYTEDEGLQLEYLRIDLDKNHRESYAMAQVVVNTASGVR